MYSAIAYADSIDDLLFRVNAKLINPLIEIGFIIAMVFFLWGVMEFIRGAQNPEQRTTGQKHMLWGVVGLFIMFSVFGIINLLLTTFGITGATINHKEQRFDPPVIQEIKLPEIKSQ